MGIDREEFTIGHEGHPPARCDAIFMEIPATMNTVYQRYEPILTIGQVPFAAGAIVVRDQMRVLRRRRDTQRWQRFSRLFRRRPDSDLITWRRRQKFVFTGLTLRRAS
jgi:hypothetical protein